MTAQELDSLESFLRDKRCNGLSKESALELVRFLRSSRSSRNKGKSNNE